MIEVDEIFLRTMQSSRVADALINIYEGDRQIYTGARISSGDITVDRSQRARRSFSAEFPVAAHQDLPLNVLTTRLQVWIGFDISAQMFLVPGGVFRVDSIARTNRGGLKVSATSLESYVIDNLFTESRVWDKGSDALGAILQLITESIPDAEFDIDDEIQARTSPLPYEITVQANDNPWDVIESLSFTLNADVYCAPDGKFRITKRKTLIDAVPVASISEGPDGVLVTLNVQVSRDKTYNAVLALGQSSDRDIPPVSYLARYTEETSPMRWGGPFGKKTLILEGDNQLTTKALCQAKAESELERAIAETRTLDFSAIPNPAIEPDDVISIDMLDGTKELHLITSMTIPLGLGTWSAQTLSAKNTELLNPAAPIQPEAVTA
jgi:hypothetical protein